MWVIILLIAGAVIWYFRNSGGSGPFASSALGQMYKGMFPKGQVDLDAGAKEVQRILGGRIPLKEAQSIFVKSYSLMTLREGELDKDRLVMHLKGYCWEYFDDEKVDALLLYLCMVKLSAAMGGSPASVRRTAEGGYKW